MMSHEERLALIARPFPAIRTHPRASWGGTAVNHHYTTTPDGRPRSHAGHTPTAYDDIVTDIHGDYDHD